MEIKVDRRTSVTLIILVFFGMLLQQILFINPSSYVTISIASGFALGYYLRYSKEVLIHIALASLFSVFIARYLYHNDLLIVSIVLSILTSLSFILAALLLEYFVQLFGTSPEISLVKNYKLIIAVLIMISVLSLSSSVIIFYLLSVETTLITLVYNFFATITFGFFIFGLPTLYSLNYDKKLVEITKKKHIWNIIGATIFIVYLVLSFNSNLNILSYAYYDFLVILFFIFIGEKSDFRQIVIYAFLYLIFSQILYFRPHNIAPGSTKEFSSYLLLMVSVLISIYIRFKRQDNIEVKK